jgi:hypothetical protein
VRPRSTNVTTRSPTANGGFGLRGRGAADVDAVVDVAATDEFVVVVRTREAVELLAPQPASTIAIAIATASAATPRVRDLDSEEAAVVEGAVALR